MDKKINVNFDYYIMKHTNDDGKPEVAMMSNFFNNLYNNKSEFIGMKTKLTSTDYFILEEIRRELKEKGNGEEAYYYYLEFAKLVSYNIPSKYNEGILEKEKRVQGIPLNEQEHIIPKVTHVLIDASEGIMLLQTGNDLVNNKKIGLYLDAIFECGLYFEPYLTRDKLNFYERDKIASVNYSGNPNAIKNAGFLSSEDEYDNTMRASLTISSRPRKGIYTPLQFFDKIVNLAKTITSGQKLEVKIERDGSDEMETLIISEYIERYTQEYDCPRGKSLNPIVVFEDIRKYHEKKVNTVIANTRKKD